MSTLSTKAARAVQRGFTLVELLIVVIILAIIAAIVIPQFSTATVDAQEAALDSDLNALRSAIELYKAQHNGKYPGANTSVIGSCTVGAVGAGAANTSTAVVDQLTAYSNSSGQTCTGAGNANITLGPYLRKGIPYDPIINVNGIVATSTGNLSVAVGTTTGGWAYDTLSGQIMMNHNSATVKDSKGQPYSTH